MEPSETCMRNQKLMSCHIGVLFESGEQMALCNRLGLKEPVFILLF